MQVIEITSLSGHSPFNISICDITLTYCYVVATGVVSVPPILELPIPVQLEGAQQIIVKVVDSIGCQELLLQSCPGTPTPTPTQTPTPTPTNVIICNCISFKNTTSGNLNFSYTQCDGTIFNGDVQSGTTLYYCGRLPSADVGVDITIYEVCFDNTCPDSVLTPTPTPTQTSTPTPTPTQTSTPTTTPTQTPTPTETPTSTPTETPTSTPTETPTSTPTPTPTQTPTSTPTETPTSTPTETPTSTPTETPTSTPTETPTSTPTPTPTSTPNPNCYYYDVTISGTDLAASTGNSSYPNNTVFVNYTDCFGGSVSTPYTVAGTYFNDICADDTQPIVVLYYQNDLAYLTISSFVTQQGNCP